MNEPINKINSNESTLMIPGMVAGTAVGGALGNVAFNRKVQGLQNVEDMFSRINNNAPVKINGPIGARMLYMGVNGVIGGAIAGFAGHQIKKKQ